MYNSIYITCILYCVFTLQVKSPSSTIYPPMPSSTSLTALGTVVLVLFCFLLFNLRKRRGEGEREGEKQQCEGKTSISCHGHSPQLEIEPATQARALTGIRLATFHFAGRCPTQSHTGQGTA